MSRRAPLHASFRIDARPWTRHDSDHSPAAAALKTCMTAGPLPRPLASCGCSPGPELDAHRRFEPQHA